MSLRLFRKSITLAVRARRRFIIFTMMYLTLMGWMSWSYQGKKDGSAGDINQFIYAILATIVLSILYAWIVINYRKKEIATLKCIGYTNSDIRILIVGELVFVTLVSFVILLEVLIHWTAIQTYMGERNATNQVITQAPILDISTVLVVLAMFMASQIIGILIMYRKILKLRPIVALRVLK